MKLVKQFVLFLFLFNFTFASEGSFLLGEDTDNWGLQIKPDESLPLKIKVGARLQTVTKYSQSEDSVTGETHSFSDFYLRRTRFQFQANYGEDLKFYMDVRNDDANKGDKGEGDFNVGDAFVQVKNIFGIDGLRMRAFRAKVDISRSQTVSSSRVLFLDRAKISDAAAQYISHNRRASNLQLQGIFDYWYFQLVGGDGVSSDKFFDAKGNNLSSGSIDGQNFMVGGKVRIYPISGWEDKKLRETYFAEGQHFSFGGGLFYTGGIEYQNSAGTQFDSVHRQLVNLEASFHYRNFSIMAEFFRFDGVVEDFSVAVKNEGSSDGYYVQGEYSLPSLYYLAPFVRYEQWDQFKEKQQYDQRAMASGINWYLRGNKVRVGIFYEFVQMESNLQSADSRGRIFENEKSLKLTSMWLF